jgi:hypothetical protein
MVSARGLKENPRLQQKPRTMSHHRNPALFKRGPPGMMNQAYLASNQAVSTKAKTLLKKAKRVLKKEKTVSKRKTISTKARLLFKYRMPRWPRLQPRSCAVSHRGHPTLFKHTPPGLNGESLTSRQTVFKNTKMNITFEPRMASLPHRTGNPSAFQRTMIYQTLYNLLTEVKAYE